MPIFENIEKLVNDTYKIFPRFLKPEFNNHVTRQIKSDIRKGHKTYIYDFFRSSNKDYQSFAESVKGASDNILCAGYTIRYWGHVIHYSVTSLSILYVPFNILPKVIAVCGFLDVAAYTIDDLADKYMSKEVEDYVKVIKSNEKMLQKYYHKKSPHP